MNIQIGNFFNKELFSHFVQLLGENFIKTFQNIFSTIPTYVFFIGGGIFITIVIIGLVKGSGII